MARTPSAAGPSGLLATLRADASELARLKGESAPGRGAVDVLMLPGFWCVLLWRLGNHWHHRGLRPLSRLTYVANVVLFGADLAPGAQVGPGLVIPHPVGVACAKGTVLGARVKLMGMARLGGSGHPDKHGYPVVGDEVWVMDGAKVFGPVEVGDRAVVGASTLVAKDVPPDMLVFGSRTELEMRPRSSQVSEAAAG